MCHSLTHLRWSTALDQLRVVASSTSNDPSPWSGQHQQIGQCLLPLVAANFFVDDPAGTSSQRQEECRCGLLLTVAVPESGVFSSRKTHLLCQYLHLTVTLQVYLCQTMVLTGHQGNLWGLLVMPECYFYSLDALYDEPTQSKAQWRQNPLVFM